MKRLASRLQGERLVIYIVYPELVIKYLAHQSVSVSLK